MTDRAMDEYLYRNKVSMVDSCHVENEAGLLFRSQFKLQYQPEAQNSSLYLTAPTKHVETEMSSSAYTAISSLYTVLELL